MLKIYSYNTNIILILFIVLALALSAYITGFIPVYIAVSISIIAVYIIDSFDVLVLKDEYFSVKEKYLSQKVIVNYRDIKRITNYNEDLLVVYTGYLKENIIPLMLINEKYHNEIIEILSQKLLENDKKYEEEKKNELSGWAHVQNLYKSGNRAKAVLVGEELLNKAIYKHIPNNPFLASNYINMAKIYEAEGLYADAEPLFKKALSVNERIYGKNHKKTISCTMNLVNFYKRTGQKEEHKKMVGNS